LPPATMTRVVSLKAVEQLKQKVRGRVIEPGDDGYDAARSVWNAMIDRRPALIVRCTGVADVIASVRLAREHDLLVAVRGGGHSIAGFSTCDDGIVIDVSPMKGVRVNPVGRVAVAQAGLTWGELDHETQAFGLAVTGGLVSTTGIAGFTLGGGIGYMMRKHGLACDNVISFDVVTADGELRHASESENPDLYWGLRGGGGNFGVVTAFEYRLHPVGPLVYGGALFYPGEQAGDLLRFYREWSAQMPDELFATINLATALPLPFLPEELHGRPIAMVIACFIGPPARGGEAFRDLRSFAAPAADELRPVPYVVLQSLIDHVWGPGALNYFKSGYFGAVGDDAIEQLLRAHREMNSSRAEIHFHHFGGAAARVGPDETAFGERSPYVLNLCNRWLHPAQTDEHIDWARIGYERLSPFLTGGVYVNFLAEEGPEQAQTAYGDKYQRLVSLKDRYDPTNLFRLNQNVTPSRLAQPSPER
jgi:hypothetical protein